MSASDAVGESSADLKTIMAHAGARCFLGGDPHLVAVSRTSGTHPDPTTRNRGGEDTTFTPVDPRGQWKLYSNTPNAAVTAGRHSSYGDEKYLFPLYRGFNTIHKGRDLRERHDRHQWHGEWSYHPVLSEHDCAPGRCAVRQRSGGDDGRLCRYARSLSPAPMRSSPTTGSTTRSG